MMYTRFSISIYWSIIKYPSFIIFFYFQVFSRIFSSFPFSKYFSPSTSLIFPFSNSLNSIIPPSKEKKTPPVQGRNTSRYHLVSLIVHSYFDNGLFPGLLLTIQSNTSRVIYILRILLVSTSH